MSLASEVRAAYDGAGEAWSAGPTALYAELARPLVDAAGVVAGSLVLDVGSGSGVVAGLLRERGARVVASDGALGMLRPRAAQRPPAVVGDVLALPVRDGAVDLVTAGFVLNHLPDPLPALCEAARVLRPGGRLLATTFAGEAAAEVKQVLERVAVRHGFVTPAWYVGVRGGPLFQPAPRLAEDLLAAAGLEDARAAVTVVRLPLSAAQVIAWRWGMAHVVGFVEGLDPERRRALDDEAAEALEGLQPLEFPVLVMSAQRGRSASS